MVNGTDLGLPTDETMSCLNPANAEYFTTIDEAHCNPMTPIKLKIKIKNPNAFEIVIKRSTEMIFNGESNFPIDTFFNTPLLPKHTREVIYEGFFDSCNATASITPVNLRVKTPPKKVRSKKLNGGCKCIIYFCSIFLIMISLSNRVISSPLFPPQ